jgi:DNA-binding NarL/FixJ family response regulator
MQVIVADDESKVRSALELLLEQELGLSIAGEAMDVDELLSQTTSPGPELLLLDWELPGLTVADVETLRFRHPHLQIIALSGRPDARRAALIAGVDAFISKVGSPDLLLATIRALMPPSNNGSRPSERRDAGARSDRRYATMGPKDRDTAGGRS